jgi:hypothetical protein
MSVWIMQCLCPARHCIVASCDVAENEAEARAKLDDSTRQAVAELIASGSFNPWCGLCGAKQETWKFELGRTRFSSMAQAAPSLRQSEQEQAVTRDLFGDRKGKPN